MRVYGWRRTTLVGEDVAKLRRKATFLTCALSSSEYLTHEHLEGVYAGCVPILLAQLDTAVEFDVRELAIKALAALANHGFAERLAGEHLEAMRALKEKEEAKRDDPANAENKENAEAEIALWEEVPGVAR